ncbi:hypothetical protein JCM33374_g4625 [Metschnikowia sp. JCM 33374]|nr:hypothetical protein JCM33374_g4625 [Metschnikowia sp. JCM 33374]
MLQQNGASQHLNWATIETLNSATTNAAPAVVLASKGDSGNPISEHVLLTQSASPMPSIGLTESVLHGFGDRHMGNTTMDDPAGDTDVDENQVQYSITQQGGGGNIAPQPSQQGPSEPGLMRDSDTMISGAGRGTNPHHPAMNGQDHGQGPNYTNV